jgi:hypothetical protein
MPADISIPGDSRSLDLRQYTANRVPERVYRNTQASHKYGIASEHDYGVGPSLGLRECDLQPRMTEAVRQTAGQIHLQVSEICYFASEEPVVAQNST